MALRPTPGTFTLTPEMEPFIYDGVYDPDRQARHERNKTPWYLTNKARNLMWAAAGAGLGLGALGGVGGGAGAASSVGTGAGTGVVGAGAGAAAAAGGMSLGSLLESPLAGAGFGALSAWMGNRAQSRSNREALQSQERGLAQQLALEQQRMTEARQAADADRAAILAQNSAQNELRRRELAGVEEERGFRRTVDEQELARRRSDQARRDRAFAQLAQLFGW